MVSRWSHVDERVFDTAKTAVDLLVELSDKCDDGAECPWCHEFKGDHTRSCKLADYLSKRNLASVLVHQQKQETHPGPDCWCSMCFASDWRERK